MKDLDNQTARHLEVEEWKALLDCVAILEAGFKKKMFQVQVRPNSHNATDAYAVLFAFDLAVEGYR